MGRIYNLDLQTLLTYLKQYSATLTTELERSPGLAGPCRGIVRIINGQVVESSLRSKSGFQIDGEAAIRRLQAATQWLVEIDVPKEEVSPPPPTTRPPYTPPPTWRGDHVRSIAPDPIPRLLVPVSSVLAQPWSTKDRLMLQNLLGLVNGQLRVSQIKDQLHWPGGAVGQSLDRLREMGVIEYVE